MTDQQIMNELVDQSKEILRLKDKVWELEAERDGLYKLVQRLNVAIQSGETWRELQSCKAERDMLKEQLADLAEIDNQTIDDLRARVKALEDGLRKYGRHKEGCNIEQVIYDSKGAHISPCTCGLDDLLSKED